MPIPLTCPACGHRLKVQQTAAGRPVRCPGCGGAVRMRGSRRDDATRKERSRTEPQASGVPRWAMVLMVAVPVFVILGLGGAVWLVIAGRGDEPVAEHHSDAPPVTAPGAAAESAIVAAESQPSEIVPPPDGELEELERMTADTFREALSAMKKEKTAGTAENLGMVMKFVESWKYTGQAGLTIDEQETRTVTRQGEAIETVWTFRQESPPYSGRFVARGMRQLGGVGLRHPAGTWTLKYADGALRARGSYNDARHGKFLLWHPDGRRRWQGRYEEGNLVEGFAYSDDGAQQELAFLDGHEGSVTHLAFSPDGGLLATADVNQTIRLWDVADRRERWSAPFEGTLRAVEFAPDGQTLLVRLGDTSDDHRLWMADTGDEILAFRRVFDLAFSPDSRFLAAIVDGRGMHEHPSDARRALLIWETGSGERLHKLTHSDAPGLRDLRSLAFHPDGTTLAVGGISAIAFIDAAEGSLRENADDVRRQELQAREEAIHDMQGLAQDQIAKKLQDAREHARILRQISELRELVSLHYSPDGTRLLAAGPSTDFRHARLVACDPESGATLLLADELPQRAVTGYTNRGLPFPAFTSDLRWSADGRVVVATWREQNSSRPEIHIVDVESKRPLTVSTGQRNQVGAISLDGTRVVTLVPGSDILGRYVKEANLLDLRQSSTRQFSTEDHVRSISEVAFAPDGSFIVGPARSSAWRVPPGKRRTEVPFLADALQIWELPDLRPYTLKGFNDEIVAFQVSPDGRRIVTGHNNGSISLWEVPHKP